MRCYKFHRDYFENSTDQKESRILDRDVRERFPYVDNFNRKKGTIMRQFSKFAFGAAAIAAAATGYTMPTDAVAKDYYEGKRLTVIVGRGPGSGADSTARAFARYWSKYIPGNPKIIVKNMKGTPTYNFIYQKAKPDGLTITFTPYDPTSQLTKRKGFKADYGKMPFVGSLYNAALLYVTTDQIKDGQNLKGLKNAKYGGQGPTGRFDVMGRFTLEILGADFRYSTGFGGAKKVLNAMPARFLAEMRREFI